MQTEKQISLLKEETIEILDHAKIVKDTTNKFIPFVYAIMTVPAVVLFVYICTKVSWQGTTTYVKLLFLV